MLELLIISHCVLMRADHEFKYDHTCEERLSKCVEKYNELDYEESQWRDVPSEEMSIKNFKACVKRSIYGNNENNNN